MNRKKEPKKTTKTKVRKSGGETITIDESRGLVFSSEEEIYKHFVPNIEELEKELNGWRQDTDIGSEFTQHEFYLTQVLQNPDEVWLSTDVIANIPLGTFIGSFDDNTKGTMFFYIALTYFINDMPRFVFLHFPTIEQDLIDKYKRGTKIFEKGIQASSFKEEAVDALSEGDEFAVALYQTMLKLRSMKDIPEENFKDYIKFREVTIEEPDEVWKFIDSQGHVLVRFIKNISDDENVFYIITTLEEETSESQYLLFSFPTNDTSLVERYRQGECLEAVSYTREESH